MGNKNADQVILDSLFDDFCTNVYPGESPDYAFELFCATQAIKPREITPDELESGIVDDGGNDGGIDGFYVFLNGLILSADDPILISGGDAAKRIGHNPTVEIFLIQSKNKSSWEQTAWERLLSSLPKLLNLQAQDADLEKFYNAAVAEQTGILRKVMKSLAPKFPKIDFKVYYATRAREESTTRVLEMQSKQVESAIAGLLIPGAMVSAVHAGARTLYLLASTDYSRPGTLKFRRLLRETDSYLGVASIRDYLDFVRSDSGSLRDELFDSNVRDYEGDNTVNESISATLKTNDGTEFWWQNNGITVLGTEVAGQQDTLTISQPLIVNGLQTTHVIDAAQKDGSLSPQRLDEGIVVRVIESADEDTRDKVIGGTNRQTPVPPAALFATQQLQRDIEKFFLTKGLYYERRKNRYKKPGIPASERISMNLLAQAMITLALCEPDEARARPSTSLKGEKGYSRVFPDDLDITVYLSAIQMIAAVDAFLKTKEAKEILDEKVNSRFYVAAGYEILKLGIKDPRNVNFRYNHILLAGPLDTELAKKALQVLAETAKFFHAKSPKSSRDSIFKNSDFRDQYFDRLTQEL